MFADWTGRWEQLLHDQKSRMYIVQKDGSLQEAEIHSKNMDSRSVVLILDVGARIVWNWHGKDVDVKNKFVGARAARALKSVVGPKYRTTSPIDEGDEPPDLLKTLSGVIPEKPSSPPIQLEDVPEAYDAPPTPPKEVPSAPPIQVEEEPAVPEISLAPDVQPEEKTPPIEKIEEPVVIDKPVNKSESKIREPSTAAIASADPEKIRDLVSLIVVYTLKQVYRNVEPRTSRTKAHDLFRVSQDGVQLCKIKIQIKDNSIRVLDASFDEKEEEESFYEEFSSYLKLLQSIDLST
ncbi:MAG: hypothetical protein ACW963_09510 [Candidatus Sifarchaeia archaeon]